MLSGCAMVVGQCEYKYIQLERPKRNPYACADILVYKM